MALISSDSLEWERTQLWALTFRLIRKIIGGVDYKVRLSSTHSFGKRSMRLEPQCSDTGEHVIDHILPIASIYIGSV